MVAAVIQATGSFAVSFLTLLAWTASAPADVTSSSSYVAIVDRAFGGSTYKPRDGSLRIVEGLTTKRIGGREILYVASAYEWGVSIFTLDGTVIRNWGLPDARHNGTTILIADIAAADDGTIFASDYRGHRILVFAPDGKLLRTFGTKGSRPGELSYPLGLRISNGMLYVVEHGNNRIQLFRRDGTPVESWGKHGTNPGEFDGAYDIAINSAGEAFVTDRGNRRVQKFNPRRRFVSQWGGKGITRDDRSAEFSYIHEIAIDAKDRVYVTDLRSDAVRVYDSEGRYMASLLIHSPKGVTIAHDQSIFVGTWYRHRVFKLRPLDEHLQNERTCVTALCPN